MKPPTHLAWLVIVWLALFLPVQLRASAQTYSMDWFSIDGGGGRSTGGLYSVSGTIGQPDAGQTMAGGSYSVTGGFWSIIAALQTPGAPRLRIFLTSTNTVVVSWPSPSTDWNLQQNANLNTTTWVAPFETATDEGAIKFIIVNPSIGPRFYRLFKP